MFCFIIAKVTGNAFEEFRTLKDAESTKPGGGSEIESITQISNLVPSYRRFPTQCGNMKLLTQDSFAIGNISQCMESTSPSRFRELCEQWGLAPALEYPKHVRLYRQGSYSECIYFNLSGIVKLVSVNENGKEIIAGLRFPGSLVGARSALLHQVNAVSALTLTLSSLARISLSEFESLLNSKASFSRYLLEFYALEAQEFLSCLIEFSSFSTAVRMARLLSRTIGKLRFSATSATKGLEIPLKQWELAQLLGVTPEHTSRAIRKLEEEGLLSRQGRSLFVSDTKRLDAWTRGCLRIGAREKR